ncbi:MAG: PH domain-containing protein [Candidatus Eisenbacteria bacterium]|uniref:PH domain-containing protein n=1 Tax=Eiseniibacteriota bacterium TaxID=2212470 RepID=A0A538TVN4_UNCEI|nr:MAG: PH domain-containing protein [Candidatus Eisenbacteria bacterium]
MSYLDESLATGETVLYRTGLHWSVLVAPWILGIALSLVGVGLWIVSFRVEPSGAMPGVLRIGGAACLVIGAVAIVVGIVRRSAVEVAVTNRRVLMKSGIVARRTIELMLSKVESVGIEQGVAGRLAGYGTVVVRGTGGTHEVFERIARPLEFRRQVQEQIQQSGTAPPLESALRPGPR